ncbi:hypothetical protein [Mesorhizobium sp. DCY119]|uniref:hypothetical protein n=1 Tax=Mesorhizobium sp. DCY119 TaxID=2108445 RepID=UPI000E6CA38E|nr:hypothetical protein [Mesorhizobium sp. DCY119]RJG46548.1 hypothetical protein D3Y55_21375 [Mesorhizobium sp. DCY119]
MTNSRYPSVYSSGYPTLSAQEFIAQGTSAAAVLSIAKFLASDRGKPANPRAASKLRAVAFEVADLTGVRLQALPRAVNDNRSRRQYRRAA